MGERRKKMVPGPIAALCFRLLELRSATKAGEKRDLLAIRTAAIEIDDDLQTWKDTLPSPWKFSVVDVCKSSSNFFEGKRHIYSDPVMARIWINWRALRIVANQLILQTEHDPHSPKSTRGLSAVKNIREISADVCISAPEVMDPPRKQNHEIEPTILGVLTYGNVI
jgi:hypothetical protein